MKRTTLHLLSIVVCRSNVSIIISSLVIILAGCGQMGEHDSREKNTIPESAIVTRHAVSSLPVEENFGRIESTKNMNAARAAHTATLLKNGSVLICGGLSGGSTLRSAEIYSPISNTFTLAGNLSLARVAHSATLLPNGKVLIAGGYNGNYLSSTELYDPETKSFLAGPSMNVARSGHTATLLPNGKILFAGGVGTSWSFLASSELYDINSETFSHTGSMTNARESHTATLLQNGTVLIAGGHKDRRQQMKVYSIAEIYNPSTKKFSATGNMTIARHKHDAVMLADGKVLVIGGADHRDAEGTYSSAEMYDAKTGSFKPVASMNYARYKHNGTSVLLPDNNVLTAGGTNKAEVYEAKTGKFFVVPGDMKNKRLFACATPLTNGKVLITGGYDENQLVTRGAWLYSNND